MARAIRATYLTTRRARSTRTASERAMAAQTSATSAMPASGTRLARMARTRKTFGRRCRCVSPGASHGKSLFTRRWLKGSVFTHQSMTVASAGRLQSLAGPSRFTHSWDELHVLHPRHKSLGLARSVLSEHACFIFYGGARDRRAKPSAFIMDMANFATARRYFFGTDRKVQS